MKSWWQESWIVRVCGFVFCLVLIGELADRFWAWGAFQQPSLFFAFSINGSISYWAIFRVTCLAFAFNATNVFVLGRIWNRDLQGKRVWLIIMALCPFTLIIYQVCDLTMISMSRPLSDFYFHFPYSYGLFLLRHDLNWLGLLPLHVPYVAIGVICGLKPAIQRVKS